MASSAPRLPGRPDPQCSFRSRASSPIILVQTSHFHRTPQKSSRALPSPSPTPKRTDYTDVLERFDARPSAASVTQIRREEQKKQLDLADEEACRRQQFETMERQHFGASRVMHVPDMNRFHEDDDDDVRDELSIMVTPTKKSNKPTSKFASLYSEDFDAQDWSLASRPTFGEPDTPTTTTATTPTTPSDFTFEDGANSRPPTPTPQNQERLTLNGKTLRPRSALSGSAATLGFSPQKDYKISPRSSTPSRKKSSPYKPASPSPISGRNAVRQEIIRVTKTKQDAFIRHHASLFVPLLPQKHYLNSVSAHDSTMTKVHAYRDMAQPAGINATMKGYQLKGLAFLVHMHRNGMPAILGDEMGLGKTLQTLSLFQYLTENKIGTAKMESKEARPFLVVCPLTVLENWVAEAKKFTPDLKVLRFHGPAAEREFLKEELRKRKTHSKYQRDHLKYSQYASHTDAAGCYDLVITTYEAFESEASWFKTVVAWRYVVLDEGHKIKNWTTKIARSLQSLQAEYRVILTGTPLQNNLVEMWALFHWLLPDVFPELTLPLFKNAFDLTKGHVDRKVLDHSRKLLELIMLRRMKSSAGVNLNLPPKEIVRLFVPLTEFQKKWYMKLLTQQGDEILEDVYRGSLGKEQGVARTDSAQPSADGTPAPSTPPRQISDDLAISTPSTSGKDPWRKLLNLVLQLRKVCTHAYLMPGAAPEPNFIGPHVYENSGKFAALHKLITHLVLKQGKKIIIFSNFTQVLDWTHDLVSYISEEGRKFECIRLDGQVLRAKRNLYVRLFQQENSAYKVFLISTKAGGIGLNLTAATEAIFLDEDWNPQVDLQAEARCHRIGQTKPVTIYKLCAAGSVEEQMLGRIHKKLYLSAKITESMQNVHDTPGKDNDGDALTVAEGQKLFGSYSEFKSLLRKGTQTLAGVGPSAEEMLNWDFETMIEKCQRKIDPGAEESQNEAEDEEKWLATMEKVECAVFEGQRVQRERATWQDAAALPSSSRADRRKGLERTVEVNGFMIDKKSLECAQWESVPTFAGKDARLKDKKRKKTEFQHQDHCQVCYQFEGMMYMCSNCPRVYHGACMSREDEAQAKGFANWSCFQHSCQSCNKRALEAGGVIFRCRWCANGYCEDCLDWDKVALIGDNIDEYKVLGFPVKREAYYIMCPGCNNPDFAADMEDQARSYAQMAMSMEDEQDEEMEAAGEVMESIEGIEELQDEEITPVVDAGDDAFTLNDDTGVEIIAAKQVSPTPALTTSATARTTAEPATPAPNDVILITPTPKSTTPSKRKELESAGGSHKKQKTDRFELEV